jgi:4-hydroxy-tetrahydrodipicolinate synthase
VSDFNEDPLSGVYVFSITPTMSDGTIYEQGIRDLVDYFIGTGVNGVTMLGSTGNVASFNEAERKRVAEIAVGQARGRVPIMIGTGAMTTAESVRLSRHAATIGASSVLVVPITYWLLTETEILDHYQAISDAVDIPIVVYNSPRLTVTDLQPVLLAKLSQIKNVTHMKEASPDLSRIQQTLRLSEGRMKIATGRDNTAFEALLLGATGWYAGIGNLIPRLCTELFNASVRQPDLARAKSLANKIAPLTELAMDKGLVRVCHAGLELMGRNVGAPRPPVKMLDNAARNRLKQVLANLE